ncbi:MAG: transcriptional regulator [Candidatus Magnetomorum sp.]|nr:transcriptional regulator [Candidatus Magnetomorum sp.]
MTKRQEIIKLLFQADFNARELSKAVGIREKEVYDHLPHIEKSAKNKKETFKVTPAHCMSCDYIFKNRQRMTRPSRCPVCKNQRVEPARFQIFDDTKSIKRSLV